MNFDLATENDVKVKLGLFLAFIYYLDQCYKVFSEMAELIVVLELTISPEIS